MMMILKTDNPADAIGILKTIYDVNARPAEGGVEITDADVSPNLASWIQADWPDVFPSATVVNEGDLGILT